MKWSKQKCRKVAFVISFCYVLLFFLIILSLNIINECLLLKEILRVVFFPILATCFITGLAFESELIVILMVIVFCLMMWLIFYGIIWLIKGEREK